MLESGTWLAVAVPLWGRVDAPGIKAELDPESWADGGLAGVKRGSPRVGRSFTAPKTPGVSAIAVAGRQKETAITQAATVARRVPGRTGGHPSTAMATRPSQAAARRADGGCG